MAEDGRIERVTLSQRLEEAASHASYGGPKTPEGWESLRDLLLEAAKSESDHSSEIERAESMAEDLLWFLETERIETGVDEWDEADRRCLAYVEAWEVLGEDRAYKVVHEVAEHIKPKPSEIERLAGAAKAILGGYEPPASGADLDEAMEQVQTVANNLTIGKLNALYDSLTRGGGMIPSGTPECTDVPRYASQPCRHPNCPVHGERGT